MKNVTADPVAAASLRAWGLALRAAVEARGLTLVDVARLVGLGEMFGPVDVAGVLRGSGSLEGCWEVTLALGLGLDVGATGALADGEALVAARAAEGRPEPLLSTVPFGGPSPAA